MSKSQNFAEVATMEPLVDDVFIQGSVPAGDNLWDELLFGI